MRQQWSLVLPNIVLVGIFAFVYLFSYSIDLLSIRLDAGVPQEIASFRLTLLAVFSALHGYCRVWTFHPFFNSRYRQWLCLSPWSIDKPLPQGPVHLIWVDLIVLSALAFLAYINVPFLAPIPVIAFLVVYLILLCITFEYEQIGFTLICLFLWPFAVYPLQNQYIAVVVLVALYVLCYCGLQQYLKAFPWNTKYWKSDPVKDLRKQAVRRGVIGWPYRILNIYETIEMPLPVGLAVSLLLTWWLHVFRWMANISSAHGLFICFILWTAMGRAGIYAGIYRPPINLWGRIFTFRWIIPKYDKVFVAPICILLVGILTPLALNSVGIKPLWGVELSFFLTLFLAFSLPPKLKQWRLTGPYRISKMAQTPSRTKPPDQSSERMAEFFSAKFKPLE
jgi:hypothetical protein